MSSTEAAPSSIVYDRLTGTLSAPDVRLRLRTRLLQLVHRGLRPVGYLGVSRLFQLITSIVPTHAEATVQEGPFRFRFPADDYYWNRLLDPHWSYEPEIDAFLRAVARHEFTFVDLGANFGYWSARVSAGLYGRRQVVAVEPSNACYGILSRNLDGHAASMAVRYAISERSGSEMQLFGTRHAGFSLDPAWPGASSVVADTVTTRTVDALLAECGIDPAVTPVVVKVDVEGVEKQALDGAAAAIAGESVFLIEDASGSDRVSDAIRHAYDHFGMRLYALDPSGWRALGDLDDAVRSKRGKSRIRQEGTNFVATRSALWHEILRGVNDAR